MVSIVEVKTKQQRRLFVEFPTKMYKDVPQYIPGTFDDDMQDWDPEKNPAFAYCEARSWLAYRGDTIVGRIGAILSRKANEKWGTKRMRFTQVDFIDDAEVSDALFATVESWARELGCDEVHGPLGFTDLDREGMLIEGFDRRSCWFTYYNYPYYPEHLARLGYGKDVDWIEQLMTIPQDGPIPLRWERISKFVLRRCHLHEFTARSRRDYPQVLEKVFALLNVCYAPLYGTVELSDEQVKRYAGKFIPLIDPRLTCFVLNEQEELVAFGVAAPSLANALKKHDGKYLPFGWIDLLHDLNKNDTIDLLLIAVRPDHQKLGVNAVVINKLMKGSQSMGIKWAETGPMLELNDKVQSQWDEFPMELHKRRRCFIKKLDA